MKLSKVVYASEKHPVLLCLTCGNYTDKIILRHSDTLRGTFKKRLYKGKASRKPLQKRWQRKVKPSVDRRSTYNGRDVAEKEIYFSYFMLECLAKKHKLSVRRKPFSRTVVDNCKAKAVKCNRKKAVRNNSSKNKMEKLFV